MAFFRNSLCHRLPYLLKPHIALWNYHTIGSSNRNFHIIPPFIHRLISSSTQIEDSVEPEAERKQSKAPLHVLFKEALGLSEKTGNSEIETYEESENKDLLTKLKQLEGEVWNLIANGKAEKVDKKKSSKKSESKESLFAVFTNQPPTKTLKFKHVKLREPVVFKELSPDMEIFVNHLYKEGYFNGANFSKRSFDFSLFDSIYSRGYIRCAAEMFGRDNQEIAKWLSGKDLKELAMFGCPNIERQSVFPAKAMRKYFEIPENTVCSKCMLKQSCKFVNQSVWKGDSKILNLAKVMKLITIYALEEVHPQLAVPKEIKESISRLMNEVIKLSKTT